MTSDTHLLDDEIDIRELLRTLFRYKWLILGITLAVMVIAFVSSKFGASPRYVAQAQVLFTKPRFITNLDASIQSTPQTPEGFILRELALDDDLLRKVYSSPEVSAALGEAASFAQFKASVSAKVTGTSKLFLVASAREPELSALIVNEWADQFIAQINALYSVNENSQAVTSERVEVARQKWADAEQALMQKLHDAMAETWKIELSSKQNALAANLNTFTQLTLITKDAQSLRSRLPSGVENSKLGIEYQTGLIILYQRATSGLAGSPSQGVAAPNVQIQVAAPSADNSRTVAEAKASLDALINSLGEQQSQLQVDLAQLRQDIISTTLAYEAANYLLIQLTTERDLALQTYKALSAQMEENSIDDAVAKLVGQAQPADYPVANRTLMKTLIAGALAFALSCFGVLIFNWWKSPTAAKPGSRAAQNGAR